jgi:hypothetical protein
VAQGEASIPKKKKSLHSKCLKISSVMYVTKHPLY